MTYKIKHTILYYSNIGDSSLVIQDFQKALAEQEQLKFTCFEYRPAERSGGWEVFVWEAFVDIIEDVGLDMAKLVIATVIEKALEKLRDQHTVKTQGHPEVSTPQTSEQTIAPGAGRPEAKGGHSARE